MNVSKDKLIVLFVTFFLLICFQFNFLYNYFLVKSLMPKISGVGYPIFGHLLFLPLFLLFLLKYRTLNKFKTFNIIFIPFLTYCFLFSLLNFMYFNYKGDFSAFNESFIFLIYFLSFMFCFLFYFKIPSFIFEVIFFIIFFIFLIELDFKNIIPFSLDNIAGGNEGHINYQLVSFFMLMTWFLFFFKRNNFFYKMFLISLMLVFLLFSGGRSELIGFVVSGISCLFFYFFISSNNITNRVMFLIFSIFGGGGLFFYFFNKYSFLFENSRHSQIFDVENSSSWQEREYLYHENVNKIINSPILGDYASHRQIGDGTYIHNALSAWQQFGILGFLFYILLIYTPLVMAIFYFFKDKNKYNIYPFLFISIYVAILCTATKPIFWPYAGISIGIFYAYLNNRNLIKE